MSFEIAANYDIFDRIRTAADEAAGDLKTPAPILVVEQQHSNTLLVDIVDERLVIRNGNIFLYNEPVNKFRAILFIYCSDCRIFVMCKVLKLAAIQCKDSQISIRGGSIGPIEIFQCSSTSIDVRPEIPILTLELCDNVHIYQRGDFMTYGVTGASQCSVTKVRSSTRERLKAFSIEDIFSTRRFYHLCNENMYTVAEKYIINNIQAHLLALPSKDSSQSGIFIYRKNYLFK